MGQDKAPNIWTFLICASLPSEGKIRALNSKEPFASVSHSICLKLESHLTQLELWRLSLALFTEIAKRRWSKCLWWWAAVPAISQVFLTFLPQAFLRFSFLTHFLRFRLKICLIMLSQWTEFLVCFCFRQGIMCLRFTWNSQYNRMILNFSSLCVYLLNAGIVSMDHHI